MIDGFIGDHVSIYITNHACIEQNKKNITHEEMAMQIMFRLTKCCLQIMVHCMQKNWLCYDVSMQKSINCSEYVGHRYPLISVL